MAVHCEKCGARVSSRAALPGHYRRAHGGSRKQPSRSLAVVRVKPIRAEVLDLARIQSEIVRHAPAKPVFRPPPRRSGIDWDIANLPPEERIRLETELVMAAQKREARDGGQIPGATVSPVSAEGVTLAVRQPQAKDAVILWQYHTLKALATRLDAGIGSERERVAFEAGLREYNANFDRIQRESTGRSRL